MFVENGNRVVNLDKFNGIALHSQEVSSTEKEEMWNSETNCFEASKIEATYVIRAEGNSVATDLTGKIKNKKVAECLFHKMKQAYTSDMRVFNIDSKLREIEEVLENSQTKAVAFGSKTRQEDNATNLTNDSAVYLNSAEQERE